MKQSLELLLCNDYVRQGIDSMVAITASDHAGREIPFSTAVLEAIKLIGNVEESKRIFIIGNGGSASIASMVANRFLKYCGLKTQTFNDLPMLSALANDFGWENVFSSPLKTYGQGGDILIAISSSGQSPNIINAVDTANLKGLFVITLSGFKPDNKLRQLGFLNFYVPNTETHKVPSIAYRHTERTHLFILDCILDVMLLLNDSKTI